MDPRNSAQDVLRCDLCDTPAPPLYCDVCEINLCKTCVGEHLLDESKDHRVVPIKQQKSTPDNPICLKHTIKRCELHCEQCDIAVCTQCVSSVEHNGHQFIDIFENFERERTLLQKDLQELNESIHPIYQEIESKIIKYISDVKANSQKLTLSIIKQGEDWHREIDTIIKKKKSEAEEMTSKQLKVLNRWDLKMTSFISEIKQCIADLKKILDAKNIKLVSEYKSKIPEFRRLPVNLQMTLPNFCPHEINTEQLSEKFGSLSNFSFFGQIPIYSMEIVTPIHTGGNDVIGMACLSDNEIWIHGNANVMKLYNLQGDLLQSVQTKSDGEPSSIAVTKSGDLVYVDAKDKTVNIVKGKQLQEVMKLQSWKPCALCTTSSDELLVIMSSDDNKQTKIVRYFGSLEKQSIPINDDARLFNFSGPSTKYICENRNKDICVADNGSSSVIVVNQLGKLRFIHKTSCYPSGIAADSQSRILIAYFKSACINIIDKDGQFLRDIKNCNLRFPCSICIDNKDNLFVAEYGTSEVKKILCFW